MRAETIALFRELAGRGPHLIISSHVLHEVDVISDQVIMLSNGYVIAEGPIREVRSEIHEQPMQILIRCDKPRLLASLLFEQGHVAEVRALRHHSTDRPRSDRRRGRDPGAYQRRTLHRPAARVE